MQVGDAMVAARVKRRGRAFEPLLGLDHCARGEPILAAPVFPECDKVGRCIHGRQDSVELFLAVAVAVREHRKVAGGKRRLVVRNRVERDGRIGDDLLAVRSRNF